MAINREETPIVTENDDFSVQNATEIAGRPSNAISSSGWDTPAAGGGNYPVDFKFIDGQFQIVKFIDPSATPFASYKEHWLTQKTSGKRSYISLGSNDPLCVKLGSVPRHIRAFTIANLSAQGGPQRQVLKATPRLYKTLYAAHHNQQFGPLNRNYWALSRTGEMAAITYQVNPVKERDLQEDWGIDLAAVTPIVNEMQAYDSSIFKAPTWDELEAIANALS
jgi:hypothetical protein